MITAVVLAAGTSSRMAAPKPLLRLAGEPMLARVLSSVRGSRVGQVVVVLGAERDRVRREVPLDGATVVDNPEYAAGMSTSIRAGLRAAHQGADAFVIVLADQPFVSPATINALIDARAETGARILIPTFRGMRGNPVLVDGSLADEVAAITGDQGCRAIFGHHPNEIREVPVGDPGVLIDFDTKEQVVRAEETLARGAPLESLVRESVSTVPKHAHGPSRPEGLPGRDVLALAQELRSRNEPFALATVVRAVRPTSGKPGHKAIVLPNRDVVGWVGGSCAHAALHAESLAAMRDGRPRLLRLSREASLLPAGEGVVDYVMECHSGGAMDIYIEPHLPKPRLLIVGDSPIAEALSALGRILDYRVTVVAPGATPDGFPDAEEVLTDLEGLADLAADAYIVVATMGKYDESALRAAASTRPAYVGFVASRRRAGVVLQTLRREGILPEALDRVRNPAGLDLSAQTPGEIALSILAEITKARRSVSTSETPVPQAAPTSMAIDVVCGMEVEPTTPLRADHKGKTYYFCSEGCRSRFLAAPESFLA